MKIHDIPINGIIQIRVTQADMRFECDAIVVATREDGLYLTPIKHEGQLIDFQSDKVQILAFYIVDGKQPLGWSGCRIRKDTYQGKLCHVLTTKKDSVRVNRRGAPRIKTDMNASVRYLTEDREIDVIVRNYSKTGICFTSRTDIHRRDYGAIVLTIHDLQHQKRVVLRLYVLRKVPISDGFYSYGAKIVQPEEAWEEYVALKTEDIKKKLSQTLTQ
ncbi:MAG: PilZ domain-containing protein [bacterium]|nr:PilZ domain-containing protein [bacterium]